ncbi:MAG: response regulator transcription factor [Chitinophagaceae bacterium]|nr:response regulator transcription factor [Chitinophagaceae bacterium]
MTDTAPIRCIIVDDEPLAVALLADYVSKTPGLQTVLRTTHVLEALQAVQEDKADLLFLDIQMPELTGIQFMKIIRKKCKVILTTAYAQYAMEGYEHDVVDYLLKPVTLDRFIISVEKAKDRIRPSTAPLIDNSAEVPAQARQDHIFIKTEYRIQRVDLSDINYIEALRDYIAIHTGAGKILSLESMRHMEEILPESRFLRIHKSYIVNRDKIDYLERGRVVIGKEYLPIGDTYKEKVRVKLGLL